MSSKNHETHIVMRIDRTPVDTVWSVHVGISIHAEFNLSIDSCLLLQPGFSSSALLIFSVMQTFLWAVLCITWDPKQHPWLLSTERQQQCSHHLWQPKVLGHCQMFWGEGTKSTPVFLVPTALRDGQSTRARDTGVQHTCTSTAH